MVRTIGLFGTIWIHNPDSKIMKRIKNSDFILFEDKGFHKGRLPEIQNKLIHNIVRYANSTCIIRDANTGRFIKTTKIGFDNEQKPEK
jgi:hypothetical protein